MEKFIKDVEQEVRKKLGGINHVEAVETLKNNGIVWHGITVSSEGNAVSPCVYIDEMYRKFCAGEVSVEDAAEYVIYTCRENALNGKFDTEQFMVYGNIRQRICGCLINTERNQELLAHVPHREFLDLSLIYMAELEDAEMGTGTIRIHNGHLGFWGIGENDLFQAVQENMEYMQDAVFESASQVIRNLTGMALCGEAGDEFMYVLGRRGGKNGAVQMLNQQMLKAASEILGDEFIILPSSVHEVFLVPDRKEYGEGEQERRLAEIVREVNDTQVRPDDILSYHVYRYRKESGKIEIAA